MSIKRWTAGGQPEQMEASYEQRLKTAVQEPLTQIVGGRLVSVIYYVLRVDLPDHDLNAPNLTGGCQGVQLVFDRAEIELDWDFREAMFRDDSTNFYLAIRSVSERSAYLAEAHSPEDAGFARVDASEAKPWDALVGQAPTTVIVWGSRLQHGRYSPQAATFGFASAEITIGIGYSESTAPN